MASTSPKADRRRSLLYVEDRPRTPAAPAACYRRGVPSDVDVLGFQRVLFDEVPPWVDGVPHQDGEDRVGFDGVVDPNLEETPALRVHRGGPELFWVHL